MNKTPNQPVSTVRDEVARLLPDPVEVDLPGGRQRQLQEFLMSEIRQDQRRPIRHARRRFLFATAAATAVAAGAAGAIVGTGAFHTGGSSHVTAKNPTVVPTQSPAPVFELAARYAAMQPYTAPRSDQWIYIENRNTNPGSIAKDKGQQPDVTDPTWKSVDGKKMAEVDPNTGRFSVWPQDNRYPEMAALPTDPVKLLAVVRGWIESTTTGGGTRADGSGPKPGVRGGTPEHPMPTTSSDTDVDGMVFSRLAQIAEDYVLPPELTAAVWRAIGMVPGATQDPGTITVDGRRVAVVGRVQDGWRFEQLLLDAGTYEFVGYRSVAARDYTFASPNGPLQIKKGEVQFTITRLAAKIVNGAGQTG